MVFDLNRRSFAERCLSNKYGDHPNFQQMFQGSKRMLDVWAVFNPEYWELSPASTDPQGFSPPRQMILLLQTHTWRANAR